MTRHSFGRSSNGALGCMASLGPTGERLTFAGGLFPGCHSQVFTKGVRAHSFKQLKEELYSLE